MTVQERNTKWIIALLLVAGCRSVADYQAGELPNDLRAAQTQSPRRVDLSAMARQAINENVIYTGDVLEVAIATGLEEHEPQVWSLRVSPTGDVDVPLVGAVTVSGLQLDEAERAIRDASIDRQIFNQPHVSVLMKQRKTVQVRVIGAVETPGVYPLPAAGSDLLAALVAAGGLTDKASTQLEIRHPNATPLAATESNQQVMLASFVSSSTTPPRIVRVDLDLLTSPEGERLDLHVEDGSVIMVKERERRSVSVIGLVKRPDSYELPEGEEVRVLDSLALAGGLTVSVADKVRVIRQPTGDGEPVIINVSVRKAKKSGKENLVLSPGDVVVIEETPTTVVVDTIRGFFRFGFTGAIPGL